MARQRLPLNINGTDFTDMANRTGYSIEYEDRTGENAVLLLSGDMDIDLLASRPVIYWPLNALWSAELAQLAQAINAYPYVPVFYFDTATNTDKYGYFHGTISRADARLITASGRMLDGMTLTLRSR